MHLHYGDDRGTDWFSVGFARVRGLLLSAKHFVLFGQGTRGGGLRADRPRLSGGWRDWVKMTDSVGQRADGA